MLEYNIWFSMLNLSNRIKLELLSTYGTAENIYLEFNNSNIATSEITRKIKNSYNKEKINEIKEKMIKGNFYLATFNDKNYPKKLKNIDDAPAIIYYAGNIKKINEVINVAIVGSRNCTYYGRNITQIVAEALSKQNIGIISGMARGIDTFAHSTALQNNGFTAAVLGCGIDIIYPKENVRLYKSIIDEGCLISEFLPGTAPFSYNFPARNRIISGLSGIVIIIEAGKKSGSLITATQALEQGIDVFAVPGSIFSEQSKGTNKLIKDGAYPLTCMDDIFEFLNMNYVPGIKRSLEEISGMEEKIFKLISDTPIHLDDIIKVSHIDIKQLYEVLFDLQLKNEILCLAGNYYIKYNKTI